MYFLNKKPFSLSCENFPSFLNIHMSCIHIILQVIMAHSPYDHLEELLMDYVTTPHSKLNDEKLRECLQSVSLDDAYQLLNTVMNHLGHTAVYLAARRNQPETLKCHLDSVTAEDRYQLLIIRTMDDATPLHDATCCGYVDVVVCILNSVTAQQRCQLLTIQAMYGYTPLHYAAWQGHAELITNILDSIGLTERIRLLQICSVIDETARDLAQRFGNISTVKALDAYDGK